jgi:hypothetical protein
MAFFELNADELAELERPVNGSGGFQSLLRRLQSQVNRATSEIRLSDTDIGDIANYAYDYEQGGWQDRLESIFGRVLGPGLGRQ